MKKTNLELLLVLEAINALLQNGLVDDAKEIIEKYIKECKK